MPYEVVVTGMGIVSSLGIGLGQTAGALAKHPNADIPFPFVTDSRYETGLLSAPVKETDLELRALLGLPDKPAITRTTLLALLAGNEAFAQAKDVLPVGAFEIGLISATTVGGMDRAEHFYADFLQDTSNGRLRDIITQDANSHTEMLGNSLGCSGYRTTLSTACASAANAIGLAARLISSGRLSCVIAGGTDALSSFTLKGFDSLQIMDAQGSRPFDQGRSGVTLGEGAAYLVLQRATPNTLRKALARVSGFANTNDAFHATASSANGMGAVMAMQQALASAGLEAADIGYINAHGTGTKNNDQSEAAALAHVFGAQLPAYSSSKGLTGHTLAASGALEAVLSIYSLQQKRVYPSWRCLSPMQGLARQPVLQTSAAPKLRHVMSNSFGFGGNSTSLIFSETA